MLFKRTGSLHFHKPFNQKYISCHSWYFYLNWCVYIYPWLSKSLVVTIPINLKNYKIPLCSKHYILSLCNQLIPFTSGKHMLCCLNITFILFEHFQEHRLKCKKQRIRRPWACCCGIAHILLKFSNCANKR